LAYEREEGPIGPSWQNEAAAATHEQLQRLNRLQGAAHFTDRKHKKNPVPEPKRYPRPYEIFRKEDRPDRYDSEEDQLQDLPNDTFGGDDGSRGGDDGGNDH
jgi:hypothetical protein